MSFRPVPGFLILCCSTGLAAPSLFTFSDASNRLAADSGPATLEYYDPDGTGWGPLETQFGKASSFGIPLPGGVDTDVMAFPACDPVQGFLLKHGGEPNGAYGPDGLTSNYTFVFDVYYPAESDAVWRGLWQTDPFNGNDAEFFVQDTAAGGIGINSNYRGSVTPGEWHRIVVAMRAAPGEGQAQRYIDGRFVGAVGTTGSGLEERFALLPEVLLLTDDNNETAPGYLSSLYFIDRAMTAEEIAALGGPSAGGANVPGAPPPEPAPKLARRVGAIGHRGGSFGSAPDNTLAALRKAFEEGAAGVEIDTRLTADGIAVCFHDETVDRTTDGSGPVSDYTLAALKTLDAGSRYDPAFAGERVPTLVEALNEARGKGIVYLDIKTDDQTEALAQAVAESQFPLPDLWFWTPGNAEYAARIREAIPGAKIFWGNPDAGWQTDPAGYFQSLRDLGVAGFSIGGGAVDPAFALRAKEEGFIVEVYTVLDPDVMRAAALSGVDYIETDFPGVLAALQPPQSAAASGPLPANGSETLSGRQRLSWVTGTDATAHRVHFGTVNPPPFIREQTSDLFETPELADGQTVYWRIDEVTPGGVVEGPVWTFSTAPAMLGTVMEWGMNGSLAATSGNGILEFVDGEASESQILWGTTNGTGVPHMEDGPAGYLEIPGFYDSAHGIALTLTGIPASGGNFINRYTFVFDVLLPAGYNWMPFFNTQPNNTNDADFFVRGDGAIGIGDLGYSPAGTIEPDTWYRVVFAADLPSGVVRYYVNGAEVHTRAGGALTDGRFSLNPGGDTPSLRLFSDEDGEVSPVLVGAVAFVDSTLTPQQIAALGGPKAGGIFSTAPPIPDPVSLSIGREGQNIVLTWPAAPGRSLQRSANLHGGPWTPVPGTAGQGSHTVTPSAGQTQEFFRVVE